MSWRLPGRQLARQGTAPPARGERGWRRKDPRLHEAARREPEEVAVPHHNWGLYGLHPSASLREILAAGRRTLMSTRTKLILLGALILGSGLTAVVAARRAAATPICGDFVCIDYYQCGYHAGTHCQIHPGGCRSNPCT